MFRYGERGAIAKAKRLDLLDTIRELPAEFVTLTEVAEALALERGSLTHLIDTYPAFKVAVESKLRPAPIAPVHTEDELLALKWPPFIGQPGSGVKVESGING